MAVDNTLGVNGDFTIAGQTNPVESQQPITPLVASPTEPSAGGGEVAKIDPITGNLVDTTGKVVKTKEQLATEDDVPEAKEGESNDTGNDPVEEVKVSLNVEGDLVDEKGNVVYKKGTFKHDTKTGLIELPEDAVVPQLAEKFKERGFVLTDNEGNAIEFEDTEDGYVALAEQLAVESYRIRVAEEAAKFPTIGKFRKHLENGGDEASFFAQRAVLVDYNKISVPSENKEGRLDIIKQYLTKVAQNDEDTTKLVLDSIEDSGEVDKKYEAALGKLKAWQTSTEKTEADKEVAAEREHEVKIQQHWQSVNTIVSKGDLAGIQIPAAEKEGFFSYIANAVENGYSQKELDYAQLSAEQKLQIDYLLYKKLSLEDLIKARVRQERVDLIKQRSTKKVIILNGSSGEGKVGSGSDIKFGSIR